jgi:anhydro-N-acetylmuramic acid kinase
LINSKSKFEFIVPNPELIDFKEAIIFAFLGVKMMFGEVNCGSGVGGNYVKGSVVAEGNKSSKI